VPLFVWHPGGPEGLSVATPVSIRDVPATVMDLIGAAGNHPMPGRSLRRFWNGDSTGGDVLYTEVRHAPKLPAWYPSTKGDLIGVQEGSLRLIRNGDGAIEVYDIAAAPLEQRNLVDDPELRGAITRLRDLADRARGAGRAP
jgi:arylsulfatase A-like enzyme